MQVGVSRPESLANVPAAHMRQMVWPAFGWCLPGRQARQVADPFNGWCVPAEQSAQTRVLVPESLANVPAAHARHAS